MVTAIDLPTNRHLGATTFPAATGADTATVTATKHALFIPAMVVGTVAMAATLVILVAKTTTAKARN